MYLQALDIQGFKSFADRTRLRFEPGITAIVGPNGCGKSNISDAIRWVLGEQRPTALRSGKMPDVIFDGSEVRKPLGVSEVTITFAECETTLETEFNEVTVTRRVHRSGESQYAINRTPCRLRDIHRLFMGTGIGTASYSVMAQGQIDAILSSRPEDRRIVFEEASGITKFKADRTEALRKLEHTDANLLRLGDVIREVKRQIGSLQRQAGKARRYRAMQSELRRLDVFATRRQLAALDAAIAGLEADGTSLQREEADMRTALSGAEDDATRMREQALETERDLGQAGEAIARAQARLSQARETLRLNAHRIDEHEEFAARDAREIEEIQAEIACRDTALNDARERLEAARETQTASDADQVACLAAHRSQRAALDAEQSALQQLRETLLDRERAVARSQNALADLEARQRQAVLQCERLRGEQAQIEQGMHAAQARRETLSAALSEASAGVRAGTERLAGLETALEALETEIRIERETGAAVRSERAALQAQLELYRRQARAQEGFPEGNRRLLAMRDATAVILGPVAEKMDSAPAYRTALQAALQSWLDAILVRDAKTARTLLARLSETPDSVCAVRLLCAAATEPAASPEPPPVVPDPAGGNPLRRLLDHVRVDDDFRETAEHMLRQVFVADELENVPLVLPPGVTVVTRAGTLVRADGLIEQASADVHAANPLARQLAMRDLETGCAACDARIKAHDARAAARSARYETDRAAVIEARSALTTAHQETSRREGELRSLERDLDRMQGRFETVKVEIRDSEQENRSEEQQKTELSARTAQLLSDREGLLERVSEQSRALQAVEASHAQAQQALAEARVAQAAAMQHTAQIEREAEDGRQRLADLARQVERRQENMQTSRERMAVLQAESAAVEAGLEAIENENAHAQRQAEELRNLRARHNLEREAAESRLAQARQRLDAVLARKSARDLALAEHRMRRDNRFERIQTDYGLNPDQLVREPDPEWSGEPPAPEALEARIQSLRDAMQAMGPVNLVAIDTYQELEERHAFLVAQENDLTRAREQILDLIRRINKKSAELFRETFEQANANFQRMFQQLFRGGNARLVLLDEDVLESGIDIVAQPPGKKLQHISLLSGGERTLTAVSLLFAIYLVKPSPFCLLDEIDAALDDSNIGRFIDLLKDFLAQSQFVIITHNPHTIASADIVYGVTMPESGVSKVVSMRLPREASSGGLPLDGASGPDPDGPALRAERAGPDPGDPPA